VDAWLPHMMFDFDSDDDDTTLPVCGG
jgi:hypothetical protein